MYTVESFAIEMLTNNTDARVYSLLLPLFVSEHWLSFLFFFPSFCPLCECSLEELVSSRLFSDPKNRRRRATCAQLRPTVQWANAMQWASLHPHSVITSQFSNCTSLQYGWNTCETRIRQLNEKILSAEGMSERYCELFIKCNKIRSRKFELNLHAPPPVYLLK